MTKKLYYDCPIKFLYMRKQFGVRAYVKYKNEVYDFTRILLNPDASGFVIKLIAKTLSEATSSNCGIDLNSKDLDDLKFYIYSDSLGIFKPKEYDDGVCVTPNSNLGDILCTYYVYNHEKPAEGVWESDNSKLTPFIEENGSYVEIIRRQGKQFFMPKEEN